MHEPGGLKEAGPYDLSSPPTTSQYHGKQPKQSMSMMYFVSV